MAAPNDTGNEAIRAAVRQLAARRITAADAALVLVAACEVWHKQEVLAGMANMSTRTLRRSIARLRGVGISIAKLKAEEHEQ